MEKLRALLREHRELVSYVFWGGMTTLVNYAVYFLLTRRFDVYYAYANAGAWVVAVLFAFFVNKLFVFRSQAWGRTALRELGQMAAARAFSLLLEQGILMLFVEAFHCPDGPVKLVSNVVVVVVNYVLSKWIIFKPKQER